jgi:hypothetical protein
MRRHRGAGGGAVGGVVTATGKSMAFHHNDDFACG